MNLQQSKKSYAAVVVVCSLLGCAGDGPPIGATTTTVAGGSIAFGQIQQTIIEPSCALSGCHDALTQAENLDLSDAPTSFAQLVGRISSCAGRILVVAGDPSASYLLDKVGEGEQGRCGSLMPVGRPPLTSTEMQQIRDWILDGAPPPVESVLQAVTTSTVDTTTSTRFEEDQP